MKKNKFKVKPYRTRIKRDDKIVVITGREKGKSGKVLHVYPKNGRILVSGVNLRKKNIRPNRDLPQGGIVEKETTLNISDVMVYCGKCSKAVRIGVKRLPDGTRMRYCKKCEIEL